MDSFRSSLSQMFLKKNRHEGLQKETPALCFPVNIAKFLRTAFFTEHLRWLLLEKQRQLKSLNIKLSSLFTQST